MKILITATNNNQDNLECLVVMLASARANAPGQAIRVYLYNCPGNVATRLQSINPAAAIFRRQTDFDNYPAGDWMSCIRASLLAEIIRETGAPAAWIDTDVVIRAPLEPFWELVPHSGLAVTYRPGQRDRARFASGFVGWDAAPLCLAALDRWHEATRCPYWFRDQLELWRTYAMMHRSGLYLHPLPESVHDIFSWRPDSLVWHRRGMNRDNPQWLAEANRYVELARQYAGDA